MLLLTAFLLTVPALFAQNAYDRGVEAYSYNKPAEAARYFEEAIRTGVASANTWVYLGLCYEQLGLYDQAEAVLKDGLTRSPALAGQIYFNLGNVRARRGDQSGAVQYYTQSVSVSRSYSPAYMNRANAYMRSAEYDKALADYQSFLQLSPQDPQAPDVRRMIAALEGELAQREVDRLAAEAAERERQVLARQEAERQAAEAARLAALEEERRKNLLDSVFSSLGDASTGGSSLGAGTDTIIVVDEDITIDR